MEELTCEGIQQDIYQHMERCITQMMMDRLSQPLPYSWRVRENVELRHFSSMNKVHSRRGTFLHYDLYFFTLHEHHVVPRMIIPSFILYYDVIRANCSIEIGYYFGGLWGKPHDTWCAPLAPHFTFMILPCRMIVAEKKWLEKHLFLFYLR